jgi:hypothetical protein
MGLTLAIKVKVEQKTSSPALTPASFSARCNAAVPDAKAAEYLDPTV